jgi:site-specific DNA recombinase
MPPQAPPRCAVLLARISDADWVRDEHGRQVLDTSGVEGQIEDLSAYAAEIGWGVGPAVSHHVVENDTSAYRVALVTLPDGTRQRRPKRPKFWRVLQMFRDGRADGLLCVDADRGVGRHPRDLEDLIDACELYGVQVRSMTSGDMNLNTPEGRARARQKVAHDNASSADTARRTRIARSRRTKSARPVGGWRRFGFEPGNLALREDEAAEIRSWAEQVLAGVPLRQIALDLRARDVPTTHKPDAKWAAASVRGILLHPAIMGKLVYRPAHPAGVPRARKARLYTPGEIIGPAPWDPIISESDYWQVRSILTDERRKQGPGNTPRWLLSVIARCGRCEDVILCSAGQGRFRGVPCYRCRSCSAAPRRPAEFADKVVTTIITRYLAREDAGDLLPAAAPGIDPAALEQERTELRGRRLVQLRMHAEGSIEDDELKVTLETFRAREAAIDAELASIGEHSPLAGIAGRPDAAEIWEGLTLGLRREIIRACCDEPPVLFIPPKAPGAVYDPELIKVNLRT